MWQPNKSRNKKTQKYSKCFISHTCTLQALSKPIVIFYYFLIPYKKSKAVSKALSKVWKVCEVLIRFTFVFFLANLHSTRSALQQAWSFSVTLEQGFSTEGSLQEGKKGSLHSQRHRPPLTGGTQLKSPASRVIIFVGPKGVLVCLTRGVTRLLLDPIKATLVNPVQ